MKRKIQFLLFPLIAVLFACDKKDGVAIDGFEMKLTIAKQSSYLSLLLAK